MRYKTAVEYRLLKQIISLGIFFLWWILFGIAFPVIGILVSGTMTNLSADISIPIIIFSIIISFIGGGSDFKFFIQNGLSRFNIFLVNLTSITITSLMTSVLVFFLSKISFESLDLSVMIISKGFYYNDNLFVNILLLFVLFFFCSSLGLLIGTLNDMLTGLKKIIVLLLAMSIPIVAAILIQLGGKKVQMHVIDILKYILGYSEQNTLSSIPLSITLLVLTGIIYALLLVFTQHHEIRHKSV